MKIGFIGLGHMGAAMAANLVRAGHDVTVFNRSPGRSSSLIELGAHEATSIAGVCDAEAVITMLADDAAAFDIALGDGGLIAHLPKGAIHLSMSTISVALSRAPGPGTRASRTPLRGRARVWAAGHGGRGQAIHRGRGRFRGDRCVSAVVSRHGTEIIPHRSGAVGGEPRQTQRQFSDGLRHRSPRRGCCAHRQGRHRPACVHRAPHLQHLQRARV